MSNHDAAPVPGHANCSMAPHTFAETVKGLASVLEHDTNARNDFFTFLEPDILAFHQRIQYV